MTEFQKIETILLCDYLHRYDTNNEIYKNYKNNKIFLTNYYLSINGHSIKRYSMMNTEIFIGILVRVGRFWF